LGICAARLVIALLVPEGEPVEVLIDDTLFRRRGKRVWAASWFHDGSAQGPAKTGYGNNWVILAVLVRLPGISRPVGVPVMAKLVIKESNSKSRLWLARSMAGRLAAALPGRQVHVVADSDLASWFHDGSAQGPAKTGYGNNWVILAVLVRLPGISRPVGVPVMAKLVIKESNSKSRLWLARSMAGRLAAALPGRQVHVVAD